VNRVNDLAASWKETLSVLWDNDPSCCRLAPYA